MRLGGTHAQAHAVRRCSRAGFEPEGWQGEEGKIIPPGGRAWSGLVGPGQARVPPGGRRKAEGGREED